MSLENDVISDVWAGWTDWPLTPLGQGWVDLTLKISDDLPTNPSCTLVMSQPDKPFNMSKVEMLCHAGTHIDAPNHFIPGAPGVDEIPLPQVIGNGVVWSITPATDGMIDADAFEAAEPPVRDGDMVILSTGAVQNVTSPSYFDHPYLSVAAARWLVAHKVKLVGCDFLAPELPAKRRPADYDFAIHRILLGAGVSIVENVADASSLHGQSVELLVLPIPIKGADGAQVRMLARPIAR